MLRPLAAATAALLLVAGAAPADEVDAVVDEVTRVMTRRAKAPDTFCYSQIALDSKGNLAYAVFKEGKLAPDVKVAMGVYDAKKKRWAAGDPIEGGVKDELFTAGGKMHQLRVTVADDRKTITRILVTREDVKLEWPLEFDAVYLGKGSRANGVGPLSYQRVEMDEKGKVINTFARQTSMVTGATKYVTGKYDPKEKEWVPTGDIPGGLDGPLLKDPGARTVYVRITMRDDRKAIAQMLVRQIGQKAKR